MIFVKLLSNRDDATLVLTNSIFWPFNINLTSSHNFCQILNQPTCLWSWNCGKSWNQWGAPRTSKYHFYDYYHIIMKFGCLLWFLKIDYICTLGAASEVWIAPYLHRFFKQVFEKPEFMWSQKLKLCRMIFPSWYRFL